MILGSKSCGGSTGAVRTVGVFNISTRPVVRDWGRQKWWPKLMVCKLWELTAGTHVQW